MDAETITDTVVIIVLTNGERMCSLPRNTCIVSAVASYLGRSPKYIKVSFDDNYIELGLTADDCCIVANSRLTVTFIEIDVKDVFNYLLRDGCLCRSDACGGYRHPLGTLLKCIISCSHDNENTYYVGVDVFTGDPINNRNPYVRYYTANSARSSGLLVGPPNIMDFKNDSKLKTFIENNKANLSWDSWNNRFELEHVELEPVL
jgi:hypothetical protein